MTTTSPSNPAFARESWAGFWLTLSTCDESVVDDPLESLRVGLTKRRKAPVTERDGTCTATGDLSLVDDERPVLTLTTSDRPVVNLDDRTPRPAGRLRPLDGGEIRSGPCSRLVVGFGLA